MTTAAPPAHLPVAPGALPVHVITVSDTRTAAEDKSGALLRDELSAAGFACRGPAIVRDERDEIAAAILSALTGGARAVVLNGGTGVAPRDVTVEVVEALLEK